MTTSTMIEAQALRKRFGATVALDGLDLEVPTGAILGVLGPNGAGKTTAVRILTTLASPDGGWARVAGHDVVREAADVRRSIGVTAQDATLDEVLTGHQNLTLVGRLSGLRRRHARARAAELLDQFDLADAADRALREYSGGMRRRLDLAMSLVLDPGIVFLDEPTTGVDPRGRAVMWDVVRDLAARGITIFLTTQNLEEADQLASRVAVLDGGTIVADGTPAELKRRVGTGHLVLDLPTADALTTASSVLPGATADTAALTLRVAGDTDADSIRNTLVRLDDARVPIASLRIVTPDLDDVFFALTGTTENKEEHE
jgi:ABC-2 type transport system ATP-binding protein